MVILSRAIPVTVMLVSATACLGLETKLCTERGCADQATITVRKADGATPALALVMEADGRRVTCIAPPPRAGAVICDDTRTRVEHREVSTGRFEQVISLAGTPRRVSLTLMMDSSVVAQRTFDLVYKDFRPNGENCEPVCKQLADTWELP